MVQFVATYISLGFHTAYRRIKSCMADSAVSLSGPDGQVRFFFYQDTAQLVLAQFTQDRGTDDTAANDDDVSFLKIIHVFTP